MKKNTVALYLGYEGELNFSNEGIISYFKFLFSSLLENNLIKKIEIWSYSINVKYSKQVFSFLEKKYKRKICYKSERSNAILNFTNKIKIAFFSLTQLLIGRGQGRINIISNKYNSFSYLNEFFNIGTKADAVILPHYSLTLSTSKSIVKILTLFDLFPVCFKEIFAEVIPEIENYNKTILNNLNKFAKDTNNHIVCPTKYILEKQVLPYINEFNAKADIIAFPAMIQSNKPSILLSKSFLMDKYNISNNHYIFMASQNRPNKNWGLIFNAMSILKDKGIYLLFVTTGRIKDVPSVLELVNRLGINNQIREIGKVSSDELYYLYKYSSLSISSSICEGLGITSQILEPLKIGGIPIVSVKSLGIKENLDSLGLNFKNADLNWIEINDYKNLAKLIKNVIENPIMHINKQKNIIMAYEKNDWKQTANEFVKLFVK